LLSLGVLLGAATVLQAQERTGSITGQLTDEQGGVLPGATVVITNLQTGRVITLQTDGQGMYRTDVDPGRYSVSYELSGFARQEVPEINALLGRAFMINVTMRVGNISETVQVTAEAVPQIDVRSTLVAHNVTSEELDRMPKPRSFQAIALTAPSVNQGEIEGGFQVNGASGSENAFTVDGVVTNSLLNGSSRQDTVFEYLQEVQVKTTGIQAEYGGALGGVISAVTKSGGNMFTGEGHYYFQGAALNAAPVKRLVLSPIDDRTVNYFQDNEDPDKRHEFGASAGGPIVRDRLFFFGSISPRFVRETRNYKASTGTQDFPVDRDQTYMQAFGKVSYGSSRVQANGSVLWTPTTSTGSLLAYDSIGPNFTSASAAALTPNRTSGFEIEQTNTSGNVDFTLSSTAYLSTRGGYFHDSYKDAGVPNTTSYTYQTTAIGLPFAIPANLVGPILTFNTPRTKINYFDTTKRGFVNVDYNHTFSGGGLHTLKGGFGYMRTVNDIDNRYPGGYVYIYWDRSFTSNVTRTADRGAYGYYLVDDIGTFGKVGANIFSLYVQDQWNVTQRVTLNLGVRTENEAVPNFQAGVTAPAFEFSMADKIAPRLGATVDVTGDGRLKAYGSWGRYFDWTKYELSRGSFGGDFWRAHYRSLDTFDIASINANNLPGRNLWNPAANTFRNRRVNYVGNVDPDILPMYQDSTSIGLEYQLRANTALTVHYVHNNLPRTIEDIGALDANGDEVYVIGNPGEGLSTIQAPSGATPLGQPMPRPNRQYDAFEVGVSRRFSGGWFGSANYTLSRLYGNYSGIASSDEILTPTTGVTASAPQQQGGRIFRQGGNANRAWDIDELLWDSHGTNDVVGRLATDRPHVVKLYGAYQTPFGTQIGAFFYGGSGTPMTTYVNSINQTELFVEGRGDMGRTPVLTKTDLLVSHEVTMQGGNRVRFELNVLNLFNQKTGRHLFNYLNRGAGAPRQSSSIDTHSVDLTKGYDYNALIRATPDGANAYDPRYGQEDLFNRGTQGQFSVKYLW
jgi:hypothetical protein